ncbi:IS66 family transposase [Parafrankia sp. BMG5.11]|uniref:IS66 family transposase n=1 Tax=Parafrankia sp. BMG5.11 TaxID=222540 RepID=UPI00103E2CA8|nr:IS66 family transposase [Parafrankia sp. BMG5.11]TCJ30466.1 IS66 family transposase [Parafrankia sp. BMG5.11]
MADPSVSLESRVRAAEERVGALAEENRRLAETNGRLRRVIQDMAERHEVELAAERAARERLELQVAELARRVGMDSSNSSTPPSKEPLAAKEKRKATRAASQRVRSKDRKPGGQPGRDGARLAPADDPDRTETAVPPAECSSCRADLSGGRDAGAGWAQVWDLLPAVLEKVHWVLPRRRCGCCGKVTTASVPFARPGCVTYGPHLNGAAVLLVSEGNVPVERAAALIDGLVGVAVSSGFVARANARLGERLDAAGFDAAMRKALAAEPVLCADETPVNLWHKDRGADGAELAGSPHVVTVRTPAPGLVWYAPVHSRSSKALKDLGVLDGFTGHLVRDDYSGWAQFDAQPAGVQQCLAHMIRHLQGVWDLHHDEQRWARRVQDVLREAHTAVTTATAAGDDHLDPDLLTALRARYDKDVEWGRITNRCRDWHDGNHPGHKLARRLADKADQVWLFTKNFAVPWTNNPAEQALRGPKRHQAVSGYWHRPATLGAYCRVRSYLVSARDHGIRALDAIHDALAGRPWLPTPVATAA